MGIVFHNRLVTELYRAWISKSRSDQPLILQSILRLDRLRPPKLPATIYLFIYLSLGKPTIRMNCGETVG